MLKQKLSLMFSCFTLLLLLTACVSAPPNTETIGKELPAEIKTVTIENPFDLPSPNVYELNVDSVTVEKRQTNGKEDIAYCIIELSNDYYHITRYLTLNYNYYDKGGWILDEWSDYEEPISKICSTPFSKEDANAKWSHVYDEVSVENLQLIDETTIQYVINVKREYANATDSGRLVDTYTLQPEAGNQSYRWLKNSDTSGVTRKWKIEGQWRGQKDTSDPQFIAACKLDVSSFDPKTAAATGTYTIMYPRTYLYPFPPHPEQVTNRKALEDAKIAVTDESITIKWSPGTNYITIGLDSATAYCKDSDNCLGSPVVEFELMHK